MNRFLSNLVRNVKKTLRHAIGTSSDRRPLTQRHNARLSVETLEDRLVPAALSFSAVATSATQVSLNWGNVAGANHFAIDEWINGSWQQIGTVAGNYSGCTVSNLKPSTTYYFDVADASGSSLTWAPFKSVATPSGIPAAPTMTASTVSSTQVGLHWNDVSGASSYLIDEWINGSWKQIGTIAANYSGCTVSNLASSTTYYFEVGASNSFGTAWSAYKSVVTDGVEPNQKTSFVPNAVYSPVSGSLFGANGPSYRDVQQGAVGDCWLLASLAEVAARTPNVIENMFTYDGTMVENGSVVSLYTVHFYSNSGSICNVVVDTELPNGGNDYDHPASGVLWVALAEKAYAEANGLRYVTTGDEGSNSYAALNNGQAAWALHAITGESASYYSINPTNIAAAWNAGDYIVLSSSSNPSSSYIVGDAQSTHAYAVVAYNASSGMPFEVYNPWGSNSSGWALGDFNGHAVYGLFWCNGSFLSQNFAGQTVAGAAATTHASADNADSFDFLFSHKGNRPEQQWQLFEQAEWSADLQLA